MGWELHRAKTEFQRFAEDWDRLNAELYDSHPYFDSRFIDALLTHFGSGQEQLCLFREEGNITGALILQPRGWGRWTSFRPSQAQITTILLSDARHLLYLFEALPGYVWIIELMAIDLRYAPSFMHRDITSVANVRAHTIGIHSNTNFADYWQTRSKNLRSNIQRYFNRVEKEFGAIDFGEVTAQDAMDEGVNRYGTLESSGWKGSKGTAISPDNVQGAFYRDVMRRFAAAGQATIYELQVDGQLAASRLLIESGKMAIIMKTSYDEKLSHIAPGRLHLYRVIENKLEKRPEQTIEFYTNATQDQRQWATFDFPIRSINLFKNSDYVKAFILTKTARRKLRNPSHRQPIETPTRFLQNEILYFPTVSAIREAGYDLGEFAPTTDIEASVDWFNLLQNQVFFSDEGVRYYLLADTDQPKIVLPLRFVKKGVFKSIEALSNYYTSTYNPLQGKRSNLLNLRELVAKATRDYHGAHVMRFGPMDPDSPVYHALLNELQVAGWIPFKYFCFKNWYLDVPGDWDAYLKSRTSKLRSNIKRGVKKFLAEGGELEILTGRGDVEKAVDEFHEVYSASWKKPEPYPDFIPSLIRLLSSKGMLRLGVARLRGKPIAVQLWIVGQGRASIYKVAYHEEFSSFSPGTVLTSHLLQHAIEQDRVAEVDFLIGNDDYKKIWMSACRERWGVVAYNPRSYLGLALMAVELLGRIKKQVVGKIKNMFSRPQQTSPDSSK